MLKIRYLQVTIEKLADEAIGMYTFVTNLLTAFRRHL